MLANLQARGAIFPDMTKDDIDIGATNTTLDTIIDEL
jgi:hypothetical protein